MRDKTGWNWLPPKLCPDCGANVFSCVEVDDLVDLQAPGRMPICWSCTALLMIDENRNLRLPTAEEMVRLIDSGTLQEVEGIQKATRDLNKTPVFRYRAGDAFPWMRSRS